ncbi:NB-ARC domain-containing protein [Streptomyces sp. GTA36]
MDAVEVARLAAVLFAGADPQAAVAALGTRSRPDDAVAQALAALQAAPGDRVPAEELAVALLLAAREQPEANARLHLWMTKQDTTANRASHTEHPINARRGQPDHTNSISGSARIGGPSVQAHAITGGVHFNATQPLRPLPVPRQLLPAPHRFVDRTRDAAALNSIRSTHLVVVSGPAGVGKTAFVSHWLHQVRGDFPDGQLYADLRGDSPGTPALPQEVLGQFLRAYGFSDLPYDQGEQAALWRSVASDLRIVVMLDNAVSAAQVRPLLPGGPGSLSVVASRRRLSGLLADGAAIHELGLLEPAAAVDLLATRIGDRRTEDERGAVAAVAALCAGLPLAICLAGARMAARPRQTVASLLEGAQPRGRTAGSTPCRRTPGCAGRS